MAIFGKGTEQKEALIDRIKYDGPQNGSPWLVYKYPSEKFVLGSQLVVNQGQEALFFKGGEALDLFGAGTHTLHTGNLPLLNKLVNLPFGGKTPFTAEVYYINKTSKLNMNWGTPNSFPVEDPKYGLLLSIRAHGTYGLRINDTRMFITELVGAVPNGSTVTYEFAASYFSGLLVSKIKNVVSAYMIRQKISFLEVTGYLDEISKDCQEAVKDEFDRFGAEVVNFYVKAITPPKDEYEKLRTYKEELALGGDFYTQRRSLDIMENLAENNGAGGLATAGAGLGMGLGFATQAGGMFHNLGGAMNIAPNGSAMNVQPAGNGGNTCPHCGAANPAGQKFCGSCGKPMVVGVTCPSCGKVNPVGQTFCGYCGTKLVKKCPSCGKENDPSQKFCGDCGTPL
ncbi:SPFH domain-containing protein [Enterococcus cecorum]|uniref:SPFH domain-containing protein n=1 Tax=Enterococcus cecorum TaxID=44008 RepID=UPI001FAD3309|nr:SPFH domain-containing protein [Enterococcus cecorum]MCJ0538601.1 SPFH domain-containing protein [Enterococcus cecorum]MCJ0545254.1 SPFH domain-containing protein [Enterococcus cecorum]MCJ0551077.1 SPFH domain-containing protein [Enterococcus cecorum]MCJ0568235.1 SPFH domain-containing protein [Enterococcus cecorum]